MNKPPTYKTVATIKHDDTRKNIPTAEYQSVMNAEDQSPIQVAYQRRNKDLDPQLVWRGKDEQDWSDLVVPAPPLYIQEKVHPKALIDDLQRISKSPQPEPELNLFSDFNGIPEGADKTEFYKHDQNWSNRMILGDSLQVMASLAEREGLRGKVQCIYFDPPYGIKFNSNFQWSTTSRDVKDGNVSHITREPEQVKAFRDTWRDGIHTYLTYLRDRFTVARDLLTDSRSIFVQIGDENVHRVRSVMDEVFGPDNSVADVFVAKTSGFGDTNELANVGDFVLWYARSKSAVKYRQLYNEKGTGSSFAKEYRLKLGPEGQTTPLSRDEYIGTAELQVGWRRFRPSATTSQGAAGDGGFRFAFRSSSYVSPPGQHWKTSLEGMVRLGVAGRIMPRDKSVSFVRYILDFPVVPITNAWLDLRWGFDASEKRYVVETNPGVIERCIQMSTDPGDLVLDPTCGSGTTAYVAEQWGRRWITIDTSRVALALARARIMGARYPYYLLADSREGQSKEADVTRSVPSSHPTNGDIRHGFVYERVPHITLKSIANNAEVDVIWETWQETLEPLRVKLNEALGKDWQEWEIPRDTSEEWPDTAKKLHVDWWNARISRQHEIDRSIAAKAEHEYLYDKPYEDKKTVRVAGPFTVESLSPHRVLGVDETGELIGGLKDSHTPLDDRERFLQMIIENLRIAGVQQAHKEDKITFISLEGWAGDLICAQGTYEEASGDLQTTEDKPLSASGNTQYSIPNTGLSGARRAAIFVGPEFGTVTRPDLVDAAREAAESGFDVLIACAFNYEAHTTELAKLGRIPILKARMNADLHMSTDLKNTGKGNLFVIFGEPDVELIHLDDGAIKVKVNGVDVFHPATGEVRSDGPDGIACWFIDTDYNGESFFVRHAYFLGANDPYNSLKTSLKAEINEEAWATLHSATSRPFKKPSSGRIAVKVINHLGDEVMKVFRVLAGVQNEAHLDGKVPMKFTPTSLTINQMLGSTNEQYVVPAYQRRYSWQEKQLFELIDDIRLIEDGDTHLFGSIVCLTESHTAGLNRLELVDGQQRLTTVSIILQCIHDRLESEGEQGESRDIHRLLHANALGKSPVPKIALDSIDSTEFEQLSSGSALVEPSNKNLSVAFTSVRLWVQQRSLDDLRAFLFNLLNQSIVIRLDVSQAKDAFKLFETINNRGLRLSPVDIIKNFLLGNAARFSSQSLDLARTKWAEVIQHLDGISFETFFRQLLCAQLKRRITDSYVIPNFKATFMQRVVEAAQLPDRKYYLTDTIPTIEADDDAAEEFEADEDPDTNAQNADNKISFAAFMDQLVQFARAYGQLVRFTTGHRQIDRHLRNLSMIRCAQTYGFLMKLRIEGCSEPDFLRVLELTEAFLLRRHVCRMRSNENETAFAHLCAINAADPLDTVIDTYRNYSPADDRFKQDFATFNFKAGLTDRARYCLETIELTQHGAHSELIVGGTDLVHLEHIIPQKIKTAKAISDYGDWPKYLGANYESQHARHVSRIGNLTLFAGTLNVKASNNPYENKKSAYSQSGVRITNSLPDTYPEFRFEQVDERSELLAELAVELWPLP